MIKILTPRRGEIYYTLFKGEGSQQHGVRPAVIVQTDFLNQSKLNTTLVCPFTSTIRNLQTQPLISPTLENGLKQESAIMGEQVITINKEQLERKIGNLSDEDLKRVEEALLLVFDIA